MKSKHETQVTTIEPHVLQLERTKCVKRYHRAINPMLEGRSNVSLHAMFYYSMPSSVTAANV